jgi:lipoprotein-anchoring transpeptidase ErfK/SrfK
VPRRRSYIPILAAIGVAVLLVLAAAMYLYDHSRRDVIANGVKIDGVSVGGLHAAAARTKLQRELVLQLDRPVTVRSGSQTWVLSPRGAGVAVDVANMVQQAVNASREGSIFSRTFRGLTGGGVSRQIPLVVSYSQLGAAIDRALVGQTPSRTVVVPVHHIKPAVTTSQLAARYPSYIVIDRASFRLRFYDHLKLAKTYEIAVGMEGLETPAGLHKIEWEQVNPPWYVPKKAWAGALAGTVVPPGPGDPLKARFMSFEGGAGIHGIDPSEYSTIGHDASHGCVRMRIPDVIDLYSHSPVGTPVYII